MGSKPERPGDKDRQLAHIALSMAICDEQEAGGAVVISDRLAVLIEFRIAEAINFERSKATLRLDSQGGHYALH